MSIRDELRQLLAGASVPIGRWYWHPYGRRPPCSTDADLIVAAVNALPDLFDQLEVAPA